MLTEFDLKYDRNFGGSCGRIFRLIFRGTKSAQMV